MTRHRIAVVLAVSTAGLASAQFTGLSTTYDGSKVYFASTLILKGSDQPHHGKLFIADQNGVRAFRSRQEVLLPPNSPCDAAGPLFEYTGAESSADGQTLALAMIRNAKGCASPPWTLGTSIAGTAKQDVDLVEVVRISPNGSVGIGFSARSLRRTTLSIALIDLRTGARTPVTIPQDFPYYADNPLGGMGRAIANNGTAIVNRGNLVPYLVSPDGTASPFPRAADTLLAISADSDRIAYRTPAAIFIHQRSTGLDVFADSIAPNTPVDAALSDDGPSLLYLTRGRLAFFDGSNRRPLAKGALRATLSGDGEIAYATTDDARVVRIRTASGSIEEMIPRTPFVAPQTASATSGLVTTLSVAGLDSKPVVEVDGKPAPVCSTDPTELRFFVPWDAAARSIARIGPANPLSPFDAPQTVISVASRANSGGIIHQNWDRPVTTADPPRVGEIIHVFAVGLGAVTPEVPTGEVAPATEPLARLTHPLTCFGHEVLYAGLAPLHRERIYQIDLKVGPTPGYQQIRCDSAGLTQSLFLTFLVLP